MEWYWWVILFVVVAIVVGTAVAAANKQKLIEAKQKLDAKKTGGTTWGGWAGKAEATVDPVEETPPDGSP